MKNEIINFLDQLGISWKYLINGLVGAVVFAVYKRTRFVDACRQVFIGGVVSAYVTPLVAEKLSMSYVGFLSFTVGIIGMVVIDAIYKWSVKKIKLLF